MQAYQLTVLCSKAQRSLYVPPGLHSAILRSAHTVYLCVLCRSQNSDYFPIQHKLNGLYNRDGACLLRGTDWILK